MKQTTKQIFRPNKVKSIIMRAFLLGLLCFGYWLNYTGVIRLSTTHNTIGWLISGIGFFLFLMEACSNSGTLILTVQALKVKKTFGFGETSYEWNQFRYFSVRQKSADRIPVLWLIPLTIKEPNFLLPECVGYQLKFENTDSLLSDYSYLGIRTADLVQTLEQWRSRACGETIIPAQTSLPLQTKYINRDF